MTPYLSLNINHIHFIITKAHIKESLESLFDIACDGYIENIQENLIDSNFHPNHLINKQAIFTINNPNNHSIITNTDSKEHSKVYIGILSFVQYLGLNPKNTPNISNKTKEINDLNHKHFFKFTITSCLIRLSLNKANRIYTNKNIIEIIHSILDFYKESLHKNLDFSNIALSYPRLELITQYNESDLDFITRLAHNNGIYFYEDRYNIYFSDFSKKENKRNILFNPNHNNTLNKPCITSFYKQQNLKANSFTQSSESLDNPFILQNINNNESNQTTNIDYIYNEHNHSSQYSFTQDSNLHTTISLKQQRIKVLDHYFKAKSNIDDLLLNQQININFSQSIKENKENLKDFYIIAIEHILINKSLIEHNIINHLNTGQDSILSLDSNHTYSNILTILPITYKYTPSFKHKPKAPNSTLGIVIGEDENIEHHRNTIHTDEYGRVRVRINCFASQEYIDNNKHEKYPKQENNLQDNQKSCSYHYSPYLRVSSPIASVNAGFYYTPRIGDEVIVSFLEDDIDKPYISGSLYNKNNPPLINLPLNAHKTSLSARTINQDNNNIEDGYNEITLSNIKDKEQIYIKAQRDYEELIKHNFTQTIENNKESIINGIYNETIKKIHTQTINLAKIVHIGGEYNTNVALSKDTIIGGSNTLNIGISNKLRVAKDSSEFIGENKEIEIGGNINTNIKQDENKNIEGNKREVVEGTLDMQSKGELNLSTQSKININAKDNILLFGKESTSFETQKELSFIADNTDIESKSDFTTTAGNTIIHQVGNTSITTKGDSIIIKAGGVEVIIDSKGLIVKGGEIKAE